VSVNNVDILVPNDKIIEIHKPMSITAVPNTAEAVIGAINFRGEVISILDLAKILRIAAIREGKSSRISILKSKLIIIEFNDQKLALSVDEIKGIRALNEQEMYHCRGLKEGINNNYFFIGALLDHLSNIVLILNVEHLVRQYLMEFVTPQHDSQLIFFDLSSQYVKTKKISSFKASLEENNLLLMKIQDG
jgi:chemotaxis signal transduction protein